MGENVIREKSMAFAVRIVNLCKYLKSERYEDILSKQLLRAGTSIGANVREGESAQSRADFISKFAIALKECDETGYWLELLVRTGYLANEQFMSSVRRLNGHSNVKCKIENVKCWTLVTVFYVFHFPFFI